MAKDPIKTLAMVADGDAGLVQVEDLRFDHGDWPISRAVAAEDADEWFAQLQNACSEHGWSWSGIGQLDGAENSGTLHIRESEGGKPPVASLIWERPRLGPLEVKIRPGPTLRMSDAHALLSTVSTRVSSRYRQAFDRRGYLEYDGRPWRGEIWLNNHLRLGPPAKFPSSIFGPQAIVVDSRILGIGPRHANSEFERQKSELAIFLTVVLRNNIYVPRNEQLWVWAPGPKGTTECQVQQRGYWEIVGSNSLPKPGLSPATPLVKTQRPDLADVSPLQEMEEVVLPDDIRALWQAFEQLDSEKRRQFIEAGRTLQLALRIWSEFSSVSLALLVVACEALQPRRRSSKKRYGRRSSFFQMVETLLGRERAQHLRTLKLNPQGLRDEHLHLGKLFGDELDPIAFTSTYRDPTFKQVHDVVTKSAAAMLLEWLRRRGESAQST